jgi:hypothetical protein
MACVIVFDGKRVLPAIRFFSAVRKNRGAAPGREFRVREDVPQ